MVLSIVPTLMAVSAVLKLEVQLHDIVHPLILGV